MQAGADPNALDDVVYPQNVEDDVLYPPDNVRNVVFNSLYLQNLVWMQAGADPNAVDAAGRTPISFSAQAIQKGVEQFKKAWSDEKRRRAL